MSYQLPKGTFDIYPAAKNPWQNMDGWSHLEHTIRACSQRYGYSEIRTPVFERTEVFTRSVGESSDIVSKEMYTFKDKGDRSMTLRPEGTAPVIRSYVENNMQHAPFQKLFYIGPYFRYDRPQAGRFRQFHQLGVEFFGQNGAEADFEVITYALSLYTELGLKNLTLELNSIGTKEDRDRYEQALKEYLLPNKDQLSEDSQRRLDENPLRILDSKVAADRELVKDAPSIFEFLSKDSKAHFERLCELLQAHELTFTINPKIVRGLDYYQHTVFEISSSVLGAQNVIGGGGRYDGFVKQFGGPDIPGVGFATGLERILVTMDGQGVAIPSPKGPVVYIIPIGTAAECMTPELLYKLRRAHIGCDMHYGSKKLAKALQQAETIGAQFALVLGEEELSSRHVKLKNVRTREEHNVSLDSLVETLSEMRT